VPVDEIGTFIEIDSLYDPVAESFVLESFVNRLKQELAAAHTASMDRGLAISVNGIPLRHEPQTLFVSDTLKPAYVEKIYPREVLDGKPGARVRLKLYAGIAERKLHEGGWYIFCNGRLVLRADQTPTTIWGAHGTRQYHPDFAYFRGFAYFDSDNAALLPWTTTKTGVDVDSPVYRNAQQEMVEISKPVLAFLSNLAKESASAESGESTERVLEESIRTAKAERTDVIQTASAFVAPPPRPAPQGPKLQKIQYSKPVDEITAVKRLLKVTTLTAVGERTFEYFLKYEGEE
jgi:hypothetical protein